jgi:FKBP-type peptidyl-prolyl cis-trans isomerase
MKLTSTLVTGLLGLGVIASSPAQEVKLNVPNQSAPAASGSANPMPGMTAAPAETYTEDQVLEVVGWFMGKNSQADTFGLSPQQMGAVTRGFTAAAAGKDAPTDLQKIGPQVEAFVKGKQEAYMGKLKQQGMAESQKFMADIKSKAGVTTLPDGLAFEIVKQGSGPNAKATDTVVAHYTGTLINGTVFDTSLQPRQQGAPIEPAEFPLDQVIPGWTEGLQKINKGGKIKLYIPPQLAYGDDGRPGIPPSSTLIFDIEVIDIKPTPGPASLGSPASTMPGK